MAVTAGPLYRVILYRADTAASFGVGTSLAEFDRIKNIGWARYLNDVGECFFSIYQDDPKLASLRGFVGTAHVKVLRSTPSGSYEVVWRGLLSEHEANARDVIFYAYGYESAMYWLITDWNQTWKTVQIDTLVTTLWNSRIQGQTNSQLGFVTDGTIQAPVTTSGGSTEIVLPSYKAYYKRSLFELKELVAVATSDTTNTCYFELAYTNSVTDNVVTFNFWKNRSTDRAIPLKYGVNVKDFGDRFAPILTRNDVFGVGSGAHNLLFRFRKQTTAGTNGSVLFGLRQEPIYLTWVRDQTDLERVTRLRSAKALRFDMDLSLYMKPLSLPPVGTTAAGYNLGDRFPVVINRGITVIDKTMQLIGMQVLANRGAERVYPLLLDRSGS